jgi:hypothetical protein
MTKGQLAMVAAKAYPAPEPGGRGKKSSAAEKFPMVASGRLSEARTILLYAPDLADEVIRGVTSLEHAYDEASSRRQAQERAVDDIDLVWNDASDNAKLDFYSRHFDEMEMIHERVVEQRDH